MPLMEPPVEAGSLARLPGRRLASSTMFRVWRQQPASGGLRASPWYFAPLGADPWHAGRVDLVAPQGTCYLGTSLAAALLEALRDAPALLPRSELDTRRCAVVHVRDGAPRAAALTSRVARGVGITAALWAGGDRPLTQRWAAALRRDGWWALAYGVQHDPSGQGRAVAVFDAAGEHQPTHAGGWDHEVVRLGDGAITELARCGITVLDADADLPIVRPELAD